MTDWHSGIFARQQSTGRHRTGPLRRLVSDRRGASAVEFALIGSFVFVPLLLNIADFADLIWSQMQVDYAAAVGAQAAYNTCSPGKMPAKINCPTLDSVVATAVRSTSLGDRVQVVPGFPAEEYYCTSGTSLTLVATYPEPRPPNCSSVEGADPNSTPADYVTVKVTYSSAPLIGISFVPEDARTRPASAMQRLR
jgi:Flp pilus assembly protein TadG